jgi:hypothetical protein
MSRFFVHCGLHKTGTSALQSVLAKNTKRLRAAGVLVPRCGPRNAAWHHNIAWQLGRDRRFNPLVGSFEALRAEMREFSGDVILSSEDFEGVLHRPERLAPLVRLGQETGRTVVWVIYLRSQAAYLSSLYQQLLKEGFAEEYAALAGEALGGGMVNRREWRFHFDFARAVEKLSALESSTVVVRNHHALEGGSVTTDFFALAGLPADAIPQEQLATRSNQREPVAASLVRFYRNRVARGLLPNEAPVLAAMAEQISAAHNPPWIEARMRAAFEASNAALCRRFEVPHCGLVADAEVHDRASRNDSADMAKLFSFETAVNIQRAANLLYRNQNRSTDPLPAAAEAEVRAWADWVKAA